MARVVVVTRNPALGMGLGRQGHDVTDVRPDRHGDWLGAARIADAVVLELSDAVAAEAAVQRLRAERLGVPVLLVSNDSPGWDTTAEHVGPGAAVLPLPITLAVLAARLDALIDAGPIVVPPPPANEEELLTAVAASIGMAISDSGSLVAHPDPTSVVRVRPPADLDAPPPEPSPEPGPPAPEPSPEPEEPPSPEIAPDPPGILVTALAAHVAQLPALADTARSIVDDAMERSGAAVAAVYLPDGDVWRVAAARGLDPEHRLVHADPLVQHVVVADTPVHGPDTYPEFLRTPLAAHDWALAVPVPEVSGLLVAARDGEAFADEAVEAAARVARAAVPALREGLDVRALARALAPYAD